VPSQHILPSSRRQLWKELTLNVRIGDTE
jgi:hypothetical protein